QACDGQCWPGSSLRIRQDRTLSLKPNVAQQGATLDHEWPAKPILAGPYYREGRLAPAPGFPASFLARSQAALHQLVDQFLLGVLGGLEHHFRVLGYFIGAVDAGEVANLAFAGLLVQSLGIALLAHVQRC